MNEFPRHLDLTEGYVNTPKQDTQIATTAYVNESVSNEYFTGNISNVEVRPYARYNSTFTPPTITMTNGNISSINITNSGSGYTSSPVVTINSGTYAGISHPIHPVAGECFYNTNTSEIMIFDGNTWLLVSTNQQMGISSNGTWGSPKSKKEILLQKAYNSDNIHITKLYDELLSAVNHDNLTNEKIIEKIIASEDDKIIKLMNKLLIHITLIYGENDGY